MENLDCKTKWIKIQRIHGLNLKCKMIKKQYIGITCTNEMHTPVDHKHTYLQQNFYINNLTFNILWL